LEHPLRRFFEPRSVAVIGASATPHKPGNDVVKNILANKYTGKLYLVNPKGEEILGIRAHRSVAELPDGIDLAIVILPAQSNPEAVRQCAAKGIKAIVLAAGGFSEVDEAGRALQEELVRAIKETGVRVIGPNTSGHTSTPFNFTSSFFPLGPIPKGRVSYVAQTGNFATHTMRYIITGENFGIARFVGLGNKVDVDECDVLDYYIHDPETHAVLAYLESFKRPRLFLELAQRLTLKKPFILLKGGLTREGAEAAIAHTAALASDEKLTEAALRQSGVVQIEDYRHLILAAKALSWMDPPLGNRVSFMAPSGAMLVILADLCKRRWGLEVPQLLDKTRRRLQDISPSYIRMRNPVDIWPAAYLHGIEKAYREAMEAVLEDPNVDAVVPILMLTRLIGMPSLQFIVELARAYPTKPIYVTFSGDKDCMEEAKAYLEPRGIPTFFQIEEPFEVLSILWRCTKAMKRRRGEDGVGELD